MRKFLSALLLCLLLAALVACEQNPAEDVETSDAADFQESEDDTPSPDDEEGEKQDPPPAGEDVLTESPTADFEFSFNVNSGVGIQKYKGSDTHVVIPKAFDGATITKIDSRAFANCTTVESVTVQDTVTEIGASAFSGCSSLSAVSLPQTLQSLGAGCFQGCVKLTAVTLPQRMDTVPASLFNGCTALTTVEIPATVTVIGENAFLHSGLQSISLPDGLQTIEMQAFAATPLREVSLPKSLKTIGLAAFASCAQLEEFTLNDGIESIGNRFLDGADKITELVIPASVKSMSEGAMAVGDSLEKVIFKGDAPSDFLEKLDGGVLGDFILYYEEDAEGFTFPRWNGYATLIIGSDEKPLVESDFEYQIHGDSVTILAYLGNAQSVTVPGTIQGKTVTKIDVGAFRYCAGAKAVTLPDTVTEIAQRAFYGCRVLESVTLPASLEVIGPDAFFGISKLTDVTLPNGLRVLGDNAFSNCQSLKSIHIPGTVESFGWAVFYATGLESVTFGEGLQEIGEYAFGYTNITSVEIPASVKIIRDGAFADCSELKSVTLHDGLVTIEGGAYFGCAITEIILPKTLTSVTDQAFAACRSLTAVKFEGNAPASYLSGEAGNKMSYTVYYHSTATGFTSPTWNGFNTQVW